MKFTKTDKDLFKKARMAWEDGLDFDDYFKLKLSKKEYQYLVREIAKIPEPQVKKPYAPRVVPSVDKLILEILAGEKQFTREQIVFGVMRRGKNVQARSVYLRLLALVKAGKVVKEGNAKRARYFVRL
jgi:hypothetical protein